MQIVCTVVVVVTCCCCYTCCCCCCSCQQVAISSLYKFVNVTYNLSVATNLTISSSCLTSAKTRLVATCHWQICYNLLKTHLRITSFDSKLATRLLTACSRLVVKKLSHPKQTHPDIGLLIAILLQDVKNSSEASPTFGHANANLNHYHYSFL